jgi:hypothetical protein
MLNYTLRTLRPSFFVVTLCRCMYPEYLITMREAQDKGTSSLPMSLVSCSAQSSDASHCVRHSRRILILVATLLVAIPSGKVLAFQQQPATRSRPRSIFSFPSENTLLSSSQSSRSQLFASIAGNSGKSKKVSRKTRRKALPAPSFVIPNPFKKLPWNVAKEQERKRLRLQAERATLHRELGIVEDATYEEIVEATNNLIAAAARAANNNLSDTSYLKRKVQIEVMKDQILQIRLNERLAGLRTSTEKDALAQSSFESDRYASRRQLCGQFTLHTNVFSYPFEFLIYLRYALGLFGPFFSHSSFLSTHVRFSRAVTMRTYWKRRSVAGKSRNGTHPLGRKIW